MSDTEYTDDIYVVHTNTANLATWMRRIEKDFTPLITVSGDCFFGWGEKPNSTACQVHVQFLVPGEDIAQELAQFLYGRDLEVVVTCSIDEHQTPWNPGEIPVRYSADHTH